MHETVDYKLSFENKENKTITALAAYYDFTEQLNEVELSAQKKIHAIQDHELHLKTSDELTNVFKNLRSSMHDHLQKTGSVDDFVFPFDLTICEQSLGTLHSVLSDGMLEELQTGDDTLLVFEPAKVVLDNNPYYLRHVLRNDTQIELAFIASNLHSQVPLAL